MRFGSNPDSRRYGTQRGLLIGSQIAVASGDTINTTTSEVAFVATATVPPLHSLAGMVYRLRLYCLFGTDAGSAGTFTFRVYWGATVLTSVVLTPAVNLTNGGLDLECLITTITVGTSGTVEAQGRILTARQGTVTGQMSRLTNTAVVTVDNLSAAIVSVTVQPSVSDAQNTITCREFILERLAA